MTLWMGTSSQVEPHGVSPAIHEEDKKTQLQNIHGKYGISFSNSKMLQIDLRFYIQNDWHFPIKEFMKYKKSSPGSGYVYCQ
ncbi:hypothetical protein D5086_022186 [Populus alba]|uniref:Uncharacterized protein n=1 Tax=Populus alba TaxID=43335 RepID=A0ACC4BFZ7_POPAL